LSTNELFVMDLGHFMAAKVEANFVDTMDVYDNKIITTGSFRVITLLSRIVTQLNTQAKQLQRDSYKECAAPLLRASELPSPAAQINA